jgi:hypothetical protein
MLNNIELVAASKFPANAHFYFPEECTENVLQNVLTQHGATLFFESALTD